MTTETSEARSDDHQVFCYIIKQLWTFQLLYMMLICTISPWSIMIFVVHITSCITAEKTIIV